MPTIHDVAKLAGVAPITVSRVINNTGYTSAATKRRVQEAAAELGYVQNKLARSLRTKRTNTIALVLTDITNPFFTTVARGVEDEAGKAGYTVTYCNTDEDEAKQQKNLELLLQQQVDGILLVPAFSSTEAVQTIQNHNTPVVVLDRRITHTQADNVRCDSEEGAYKLVCHLIALGHRYIAFLGGPKGASTADDRLAGYKRAMDEIGFIGVEEWVQFGSFNQESGYAMAQNVIQTAVRPTAIFAANNFIAIGAVKALQDSNLLIPEDMALVGFDDLPPALVIFPFLTVAAQPAYEMAQIATRLLLARIEGKGPDKIQEIILPTELIVRRSSGQRINVLEKNKTPI